MECSACFETFEPSHKYICSNGHESLCEPCLIKWITTHHNATCPICRSHFKKTSSDSDNPITPISLMNLQALYLSDNQLTYIPPELQITNLQALHYQAYIVYS